MNFFITGTDTGVGKTHVTALLLAELRRRGVRAAGFKPFACGSGGRADARQYWELMNREVPLDRINPVYLRHALAPSVAARLEKRHINLKIVTDAYSFVAGCYSSVFVEGAGGLLVPIQDKYFMADLARDLKLPVVIVSRLGLGAINHALLTVRQAQANDLPVAGIILNNITGQHGLAERTNLSVIPRLTGVRLLGVVPHGPRGALSAGRRILSALFQKG